MIHVALDPPRRDPPASVVLRLRHPQGAAMRAVTCNGAAWTRFDPASETIELGSPVDPLRLDVRY